MLRIRERTELFLNLLIKEFYSRVNIIVTDKILDIFINNKLLIYINNKVIIPRSPKVASSNAIID